MFSETEGTDSMSKEIDGVGWAMKDGWWRLHTRDLEL
jgi:hypothetical protein